MSFKTKLSDMAGKLMGSDNEKDGYSVFIWHEKDEPEVKAITRRDGVVVHQEGNGLETITVVENVPEDTAELIKEYLETPLKDYDVNIYPGTAPAYAKSFTELESDHILRPRVRIVRNKFL